MELTAVDQLVCYLANDPKSASQKMRVAGFTEEQVLQPGLTLDKPASPSRPLGMDRLTEVGRSRPREIGKRSGA